MVKTLVTGGAGFIGSNLVALLVDKGYDVTVCDNLSSGYESNLSKVASVAFVRGDIRDAELLARLMEGVDVVFHLAASVGNSRSIEQPIADCEINVIGTLQVLNAARRAGVHRIVFSSSAAIFGELKQVPIPENHPAEPDSPYGVSKLAAEKQCLVYAKLFGLEVICLRYFNVYGLNQRYDTYGNVIPIFTHRLLRSQPLIVYGDGEQTRDFVSVKDIARANLLAAEAEGISGAFNIASGRAVTINHLIGIMQSVSGIELQVNYVAPRKGDVRHSRADISSANKVLGYRPSVDIQEGISEYWHWAKTELV